MRIAADDPHFDPNETLRFAETLSPEQVEALPMTLRQLVPLLLIGFSCCLPATEDGGAAEAAVRKAEPRPLRTTVRRVHFPPAPSPATIRRRDEAPPAVDLALVQHGKERFDIFCSPCHGYAGYGDGMVVERGFPAPPSFHNNRLRQMPASEIFDTISNGHGVMYSYADRVPSKDRWAIAAYVRALQLSQVHADAATSGNGS